MAVEVTMPKFGLTMHEGTIQRFFKHPGDRVTQGEPLYEVETEKVLYEVEAPASGTLVAALFNEGDTVECGVAVAVIAENGDDVASLASRYGGSASAASNRDAQRPARNGPAAEHRTAAASDTASAPPPSDGGRRAASPLARKLAQELNIDLDHLVGSGPGGRITREDVARAAFAARSTSAQSQTAESASRPRDSAANAGAPGADATASATGARRIPVRGVRKVVAERMHQSLRDSAQITIASEADVTAATELRARLKTEFDVSYNDMIVHAVARALVKHPRMNSRFGPAEITLCDSINVGIAVAIEDGLIVPVIHDAARKSLGEIAIESKALGEKARAGRLRLEDVTGGTFTITNLGAWGVDTFTPILNPGETGILGVGRIIEKPAIYRDQIARRAMMMLSLTFDHRVIDGAPAAEFLRSVIDILNYGER